MRWWILILYSHACSKSDVYFLISYIPTPYILHYFATKWLLNFEVWTNLWFNSLVSQPIQFYIWILAHVFFFFIHAFGIWGICCLNQRSGWGWVHVSDLILVSPLRLWQYFFLIKLAKTLKYIKTVILLQKIKKLLKTNSKSNFSNKIIDKKG